MIKLVIEPHESHCDRFRAYVGSKVVVECSRTPARDAYKVLRQPLEVWHKGAAFPAFTYEKAP